LVFREYFLAITPSKTVMTEPYQKGALRSCGAALGNTRIKYLMRRLVFSATAAWLAASYAGWVQSPPVDPRVVFPDSDDAMARALADPKLPPEVKAELFTLFDTRLGPQLIEDDAGNIWLYRRGEAPVITKRRKN
jgi:hypothetical protein